MCGIGGFYAGPGNSGPLKRLKALWRGLEARGVHAAGFALQWRDGDSPVVVKQAGPGHRLHKRLAKFVGDASNTQYVLLHTRFTTQGSTANNTNNHPVVSEGMVVTHNGVLYNDSDILAQLGVIPVGEVDTEAINAGLRHQSPGWVLDEIDGSMSVAWVDSTKSPDTVNLMTNGENPLVIARTESDDVVWASTKSILDKSGFKVKSFFHAQPFKVYTINPDGIIRSEVVSDQRSQPDLGEFRHRASRPQWWEMGATTSSTTGGRQNARKGAKKTTKPCATTRISPMTNNEHGIQYAEADLEDVMPGYDWDAYFEAEGYEKVWKGKGWVWVPSWEVSQ